MYTITVLNCDSFLISGLVSFYSFVPQNFLSGYLSWWSHINIYICTDIIFDRCDLGMIKIVQDHNIFSKIL
jgi:hypothetical protein